MKITDQVQPGLGQVNDSGAASRAGGGKGKAKKSGGSSSSDQVVLSNNSKLAGKASQLVESTSDIRVEKVKRLKEQIESGNYKVDSSKVADKMVEEHLKELI